MADRPSQLSQVSGSTSQLLGVPLLGEIDNSAFYVDSSKGAPVAITVMVEVKNTRSWYYADDVAVLRFLAKAALLQAAQPDALILPVFVCRQYQFKLWELGEAHGFLPAKVLQQLVLADSDLDQDALNEVAAGLGYQDLKLGNATTNRHRGIFATSVPKNARTYAQRWRENYYLYLPAKRVPPVLDGSS